MDAPGSIAPQPFLEWPGLARLLVVLNAPADRGLTRIVGGAIRNAVLGRPVVEVDLASVLVPEEVTRRARGAGFEVLPTGLAYGTVTVFADGRGYEVTTLRRDLATDGRRATVVAFGEDWVEDARRRDLTINALYCDGDGTLFDPIGGFDDVMNARVRFIGDPDARIAEDYLRVLRFFRFHAQYAVGPVDAAGFHAAVRARRGMARLSAERVRAELLKLLVAPGAVEGLGAFAETGIPTDLLGVLDLGSFRRLADIEAWTGMPPSAVRRLAALAARVSEDAERLAFALRLSRVQSATLEAVTAHARGLDAGFDRVAARRLLHRAREAYADVVLVAAARAAAPPPIDVLGAILALPTTDPVPPMPLRGADLVAEGIPAGVEIGRRLARAEAAWVDGDFSASRERLLAVALRAGDASSPP